MKKIGIFGIGSIGSVLAKYLSKNENNICSYFNRNDNTEAKVKFQNEVSVVSISPLNVYKVNLDWLIVCLKEYHYQNAMIDIEKLLGPKTKVAIFRNGLRLSSNFLNLTSQEMILETIIDCPTQLNEEGVYVQFGKPKICLPVGENSEEFVSLFALSEIKFTISNNFLHDQWSKLIESASLGAIQCLTEQPCVIFRNNKWFEMYEKLIDEGIKVAQSDGVDLGDEFKSLLLQKLKSYPPEKASSMLSDKLNGNKLELDAKAGIIVKIAEENNLIIPTTRRLYDSLQP